MFNTYISRAAAYASQGEFDLALVDYNHAIEINSEEAEVYTGRGDIYFQQEETDLAFADYDKAVEFDPVRSKNLSCE